MITTLSRCATYNSRQAVVSMREHLVKEHHKSHMVLESLMVQVRRAAGGKSSGLKYVPVPCNPRTKYNNQASGSSADLVTGQQSSSTAFTVDDQAAGPPPPVQETGLPVQEDERVQETCPSPVPPTELEQLSKGEEHVDRSSMENNKPGLTCPPPSSSQINVSLKDEDEDMGNEDEDAV